jgi:predicted  nucleic acid-binding Zn-ribbon protein
MSDKDLRLEIDSLTKRISQLESQLKDLQSQQLETGNNIVTLIQHAETMNNVTDASGLLAQHVTELEEKINLIYEWIQNESKLN